MDRTLDPDKKPNIPSAGWINYICEHGPSNSTARKLLLDTVVGCCARTSNWPSFVKHINHDFLGDVVLALADDRTPMNKDARRAEIGKGRGKCKYHHHAEDQPCLD